MKRIIQFTSIIFIFVISLNGQGNQDTTRQYIHDIFYSTHIVNSHSIKQLTKNSLDFVIYHRFGNISGGIDEFFGLDVSTIRFALQYAITDKVTIGIGRSSYKKNYDGFLKINILTQCISKTKSIPVSMTYFAGMEIFSKKFEHPERKNLFSSRISYIHQLLIARKFNENISLQLMPTILHRNLVKKKSDPNDIFALGLGGRFKLSYNKALTFEYYKIINDNKITSSHHDFLAIGFDIETALHTFQFSVSNSYLMQEAGFIAGQNNGDFFNGDLYLGFNITRLFYLE